MTKGDVEDASGEGEEERWFGEKGRDESSEMENGSQRDCCWGKSWHPRLRGETWIKIGSMMMEYSFTKTGQKQHT